MDDKKLRENILAELDYDPMVKASSIGVSVENGIVTLNGHVSSYTEKLAAVGDVRRLKGVRGIADEIEVRHATDKKTADDQIAQRAIDILRWSAVIPADAIKVTVRHGWVSLTGQVNWQYEKRAAEREVRRLSGVVGVVNDITLKPNIMPADVKKKIEDALKRSAEIEAAGIRVSVTNGGRVTLEGHVHDWHERFAVENAVWAAPGVVDVEDRLTIN